MWSSDSDGDTKMSDVQLIPLTVTSPSSDTTSPVHKMSPPATSSHSSEANTSMAPRVGFCDYTPSRKRLPVMSYPPRTSNPDVQCMGSYHTLPAETLNSKPVGDFKQLMENLAKKSEDVLKSKIFHSDSCEEKNSPNPSYDVILNISFEDASPKIEVCDDAKGKQITDITQEIENLTRTMDDLQKSMSSIELEEADLATSSDIVSKSSLEVTHSTPSNTTQTYCGPSNIQKVIKLPNICNNVCVFVCVSIRTNMKQSCTDANTHPHTHTQCIVPIFFLIYPMINNSY